MVFLPSPHEERGKLLLEAIAQEEQQPIIAWRRVPTQGRLIGTAAQLTEPSIWQCFVQRQAGLSEAAFERKLFVIRKVFEQQVAQDELHDCYVASLSARTLVYKGC